MEEADTQKMRENTSSRQNVGTGEAGQRKVRGGKGEIGGKDDPKEPTSLVEGEWWTAKIR